MQRNVLRCSAFDENPQKEESYGNLAPPQDAKQAHADDGERRGACDEATRLIGHCGKTARVATSFLAARSSEMVDAEHHAILIRISDGRQFPRYSPFITMPSSPLRAAAREQVNSQRSKRASMIPERSESCVH